MEVSGKARWGARGRENAVGFGSFTTWDDANATVYLLLMYRKVDQDDLTPRQLKVLRKLVREELK